MVGVGINSLRRKRRKRKRRRSIRFRPMYSSRRAFVPDYRSRDQYLCQSKLEEEFFTVFAFLRGSEIVDLRDHPFDINYVNPRGRVVRYPPDALIVTLASQAPSLNIIGEVKYQSELQPDSTSFDRIREHACAGLKCARELGSNWTYIIFTEKEIETPLLDSVEFLTNFASKSRYNDKLASEIINLVGGNPGIRVKQVSRKLGRSSLPVLYYLFYHHDLRFDYRIPLRSESQRLNTKVFPGRDRPIRFFDLIEPFDLRKWF